MPGNLPNEISYFLPSPPMVVSLATLPEFLSLSLSPWQSLALNLSSAQHKAETELGAPVSAMTSRNSQVSDRN
jgi:hypothetical protein